MTTADDLTQDGLAPSGEGRVLVLGCGAIAREILAIMDQDGLRHLDLACLPAILHNSPERIVPEVEKAVAKHRSSYDKIFVAFADCGTGGALEAYCAKEGIGMIPGPHCYAFFEGNAAFAAHEDEITAFYLTDFLTRQFDAFVIKPLGLDRHPELRDAYFGHYTKLVYLAQLEDPALDAKAQAAADTLGLAYEKRVTGYGDLRPALTQLA